MGQKITIAPVTRIEGHAKITIHLDDAGRVERAFFHVEQFRGFEKFSEGRMYYEMAQITPRICGICPVSHHLAATKAADEIAGTRPTPTAHKLRELLHMGQVIQSHGMHFFELAGPDLLLGFDAEPKSRNVAGLVAAQPELALRAVQLRAFGQELIRTLGGRRIHPLFGVPGGVTQPLGPADRERLRRGVEAQLPVAQTGLAVWRAWAGSHQETLAEFAVFPSSYLGLVDADGALALYEGRLRLVDAAGMRLADFAPRDYLDTIAERVEPYSYLKFPFYKPAGWPGGVYRVGPLARLNVATHIRTPLAQAEMARWKALAGGRPVEGTLQYHFARLIELLYALERAAELLDDPEIAGEEIAAPVGSITGEGVGCLEAPRGTLLHHYWTDERGVITRVNLIVATGHNNWAMNQAVNLVARRYIDGCPPSEGVLNRVEAAIRAHDPCLSCSTHAVGKMPLLLEFYTPDGRLLHTMCRE